MARWSIPVVCLMIGGAAGSFVSAPILHGQNAGGTTPPREIGSYRDVVKSVLPAVVSIESKVKPKVRGDRQPRNAPRVPEGIPDDMRRFFEEFNRMPMDMEQIPVRGFGSGFIIDPKGVVLTN